MSLRVRLALVTTAVVAVAVALVSIAVFVSMRADLLRNVDNELNDEASAIQGRPFVSGPLSGKSIEVLPPPHFGQRDYFQLVGAEGKPVHPETEQGGVPIDARTRAVAAGKSGAFFADTSVAGVHARVLTVPIASGVALQIASPLDSVDR